MRLSGVAGLTIGVAACTPATPGQHPAAGSGEAAAPAGEGAPLRWVTNHASIEIPIGRYLYNSVYISVFAIIGNLLGSSLAAFSFARMRYPGKNFLFLVMLSTLMVPA